MLYIGNDSSHPLADENGFDLCGLCGGDNIVYNGQYIGSEIDCNGYCNPLYDSDNDGSCDSIDICPGLNDFLDSDGDSIVDCLEIFGCTDIFADNYNNEATMNDPDYPCTYPAEINQDCNGDCTAESDCAGDCGGDADGFSASG